MKVQWLLPVAVTVTLTLEATVFLASPARFGTNARTLQLAQARPPATEETSATQTTFTCDANSNTPVTLALVTYQGQQYSQPILTWLSEYFPDRASSKQLCQQVASKLQAAYNAGELKNLALISGEVNQQAVVCLVEDRLETQCTPLNVLFALESTDRPSSEVLAAMVNQEQNKRRGLFRLSFSLFPF